MRLLKLRLKNLNSLRCDEPIEIDLATGPIGQAGIFAITGETGSGKSTLLDALCLALYGRTPRLENENPDETVLSHGAAEASSELTYETPAGTFTSKWEVQRAYKKLEGKLQASQISVRQHDGTPEGTMLASGKEAGKAKNLELLGLDLENFKRAVMLAQGEFSRFLESNPAERSEILEKVTGTKLFTQIGKACHDRKLAEEKKLSELTLGASALPLLSEETRLETSEQLETRRSETEDLDALVEQLKRHLDLLAEHVQWKVDFQKAEEKREQAEEAHRAAADRRSGLETFDALQPLATDLRQWAEDGVQHQGLHQRFEHLNEVALPEATRAQEDALKAEGNAHQALGAAEHALETQHKPLCDQVLELDGRLREEAKLLEERRGHLLTLDRETGELTETRADLHTERTHLEQAQQALGDWLQAHASDAGLANQLSGLQADLKLLSERQDTARKLQSRRQETHAAFEKAKEATEQARALEQAARAQADKTRQALTELQDRLHQLTAGQDSAALAETLLATNREIQSTSDRMRALEDLSRAAGAMKHAHHELEEVQAQIAQERQRITPLEEACQAHTKLLEALEARLRAERDVQSLKDYRRQLKEGTPCPCCGSLEHPWAQDLPPMAPDATEQERKRAAEALQDLRDQLAKRQEGLRLLESRKTQHEGALAQECQTLSRARGALQGEAPEERLDAWILEAQHHAAARKEALEQTAHDLGSLRSQAQELERQIEATAQRHSEERETASKASEQIRLLESEERQSLTTLADLDQQVKDADTDLQGQRSHCSLHLAPYGLRSDSLHNAQDIPQVLSQLAQRSADHQEKVKEESTTGQSLAALALKVESVTEQIEKRHTAREGLLQAIENAETAAGKLRNERRSLFGEQDPRTFLADLEQQLKALREASRVAAVRAQESTNAHGRLLEEATANTLQRAELEATLQSLLQGLNQRLSRLGWNLLPESEPALWEILGRTAGEAAERLAGAARTRKELANLDQERALAQATLTSLERSKPAPLPEGAELDAASLDHELQETKAKANAAHQAMGALRQQLETDDANRREKARIDALAGDQRAVCDRWVKLHGWIGSANGEKFRTLAQGLNLRRLLVCANGHLQRYNDRYLLVSGPELTDMDLQIQDGELAQTVRTLKNLSGGETFQISLALALGLSEMQGGTSGINTLLIDEGFGTLDAETLRRVMEALQSIKRDGKTVGIITHVRDIREHIPVGLHIEKMPGGVGRVTLVSSAS